MDLRKKQKIDIEAEKEKLIPRSFLPNQLYNTKEELINTYIYEKRADNVRSIKKVSLDVIPKMSVVFLIMVMVMFMINTYLDKGNSSALLYPVLLFVLLVTAIPSASYFIQQKKDEKYKNYKIVTDKIKGIEKYGEQWYLEFNARVSIQIPEMYLEDYRVEDEIEIILPYADRHPMGISNGEKYMIMYN